MDQDQPDIGQSHSWQPTPPPMPPPDPWRAHHTTQAVPPPIPPSAGPAPRPRTRTVAISALIGALVGGGISGGIVAAVDGNRSNSTVAPSRVEGTAAARPSSVLSKPGDIRSILAKVEPAVVRIDVTSNPDAIESHSGTGTGFIVASDGIIVTNAHVANAETTTAADQLVVTLRDGDSVRARVVGEDKTQDLAVLEINRTDLPTVQLGNSDALQVGDAVVAIGNALGIAGSPTVTSGIVSGLGRTVRVTNTETLVDAIQTDAAINPGNSGGPLVDVNGRVIGINTAIADPSSANNIGFAISMASAEPVISDLRAGRKPRIAYMGVSTQTVTPSLVQLRHLHTDVGAYVAVVTQGAGADRAGVHRGDVMLEVDGTRVTSNDDVLRIVRRHRPGEQLRVVIMRDKTRKTFEVTLGVLPNA